MKLKIAILSIPFLFQFSACTDLLSPKPVDRITNDLVIKDESSARVALTSVYRSFANLAAPKIVAGDMMADNLLFNGTFTQYLEIGNKDLSTSNGSANALWGVIYSLTYTVNFILEGLPKLDNISPASEQEIMAAARFLRGYAYFVGAYTYGGLPIVTTTNIDENRKIPRASMDETLKFIEDDLLYALDKLPQDSFNSGDATNGAVKAALARFYLYKEDWDNAIKYATDVIDGNGVKAYSLEDKFSDAISDFSSESVLEVVYSANDNPGTSSDFSINNLFEGRRELIPSNEIVEALKKNGGDRQAMIEFDSKNSRGSDNGWTVVRYGPFDNIPVFRLPEMYLIRAEARAQKGNISGASGADADVNVIRARAGMPLITGTSKGQILQAIEDERRVELAFEGHRWYDLKRTGRAKAVMEAFTNNWSDKDLLWPVPLREIQNNPALKDAQNPGY